MLPSFANQAYTRKRYPTTLDHGKQVRDLSGTPATAVYYGSIQPGTGLTDFVNRSGVEVVYTIWGEVTDDVQDDDTISYNGKDYFVNGEPERWQTGVLDHMVVRLSRWEDRSG